ncbi:DUF4350 domain-containing protein [Georgenia faecalis]|uniref:DUF4350 domain-containing protein n=1 Tax=Georgenia faecalis TaxID=2483799 RepID=UPI000FD6F36A|nr:DUF4350 domain-containing protein [Georgenia faecalis]
MSTVAPPTAAAPAAAAPTAATVGPPTAQPGGHARARRRRPWFPVVAVVVLLASIVLLVLARSTTSALDLSPDNPQPGGAMAAAEILSREGVHIRTVRTTDDAIALAGPGTTLLVTATNELTPDQLSALRGTQADLVVTDTAYAVGLDALTSAVEPDPAGSRDAVTAQCTDPDAVAAGRISGSTGGLRALTDDVEVCFPAGEDAGAYAVWEQDGRTVRALADSSLLTNARLAEDGNAALVLRTLGHHDELVWYLPTPGDAAGASAGGPQLLPPEAGVVGLQLLVLALALMAWRGRRLGRVVTEPLPVVVRSAETTRGRGRLYRRSRAHAHAAAALRAGCAHRLARSLGLPRSAAAGPLLEAAARATGRSEDELGALLYGPPPTDDAGLLALAHTLDTLESEVHRS